MDSGNGDAFVSMVASFSDQISFLKNLCIMRSSDSLEVWQSTLRDLDARITQIERHKSDLRTTANRELRYVGQAKELIELLKQQQEHTLRIEAQLPPELRHPKPKVQQPVKQNNENMPPPTVPASTNIRQGRDKVTTTVTAQPAKKTAASTRKTIVEPLDGSTSDASRRRKKGFVIPTLVHVTKEELSSCPSYVRGRLTVQKVNAAIDEIMQVIQDKYRILAQPANKINTASRAKHQLYTEQQREAGDVVFFTDDDIKASQHVKFDATGKAILSTLQTLGRLKIDGGRVKKYVLQGTGC